MPRAFEGARTKKQWIEARQQWRVTTIYPDKSLTSRHFAKESHADLYRATKDKELNRLGEVTFEKAIHLYERHRLADLAEKTVVETTRRLNAFFVRMIKSRVSGLNEKTLKEAYEGRYEADRLVLHGLVNRPTLRRAKDEPPAPCRLPCKCPHDGPALAPDSHRNYLAEAKTFLRWCQEREFMGELPVEKVKGTGKRNPGGLGKTRLRKKELKALYRLAIELAGDEHAGDEGATAVLFALCFGMRATEIVTRQVRDIDDESWSIEVDPEAAKTKSSERGMEVPAYLRPAISRLMRGKQAGQYLFGDGVNPHWRDWVTENVQRLCKELRLPLEHAHGLRGAHNDLAEADGQTAAAIERQLGHEGSETRRDSYTSEIGRKAAQRKKAAGVLEVLEGGKAAGGSKE